MLKVSKNIINEYITLLRNRRFQLLVIFICTLLLTYQFFIDYLQLSYVAGWDGTSHFALSKYIAEQGSFPTFVPLWNMGNIWPVGYSPVMTIVLALLYRLLPFSEPSVIFKWVFILATTLLPIIVYYSAQKITRSKLAALLSALATTAFLVSSRNDYVISGGINMRGTFQVGLYPHLFASIIFFLWLILFLNSTKQRQFYSSILLFVLMLLTNLHVFQVAIITFVAYWTIEFIYQRQIKLLRPILLYTILTALISAFWLVPNLLSSSLLGARTDFNVVAPELLVNNWPLICFAILGSITAYRKSQRQILTLALASLVTTLIAIIPIYQFIPALPLQPNRLMPLVIIFWIIISGYGIGYFKPSWQFINRLTLSIGFLIIAFSASGFANRIVGGFRDIGSAEMQVVELLKSLPNSRSLVEITYASQQLNDPGFVYRPSHSIITGLIAGVGHESLWGIFREPSPSISYIQPIENQLSQADENYGFICWLCTHFTNAHPELAAGFDNQPLANKVKLLKLTGVTHVAASSEEVKGLLRQSGDFKLLASFDRWQVYELTDQPSRAETIVNEPLLTFAHTTNGQTASSYSWQRISEEWLYSNHVENIIVNANQPQLDVTTDLENFNVALIVDYRYTNLETAYQKLNDFAQKHQLYLLESTDPLFRKLEQASDKVKVIKKTGDIRSDLNALWSSLPINSINKPTDVKLKLTGIGIEFESNASDLPQKVLLKYAYSPLWKTNDGIVYLAGANQMVVVTQSSKSQLSLEINNFAIFISLGSLIFLITRISPLSLRRIVAIISRFIYPHKHVRQ